MNLRALILLVLSTFTLISCKTKKVLFDKNEQESYYTTSISYLHHQIKIDENIINRNYNLPFLITAINNDSIIEKQKVEEIPLFVKSFLDSVSHDGFSIANLNQNWQVGCCVDEKENLPRRQLVYLGIGNNILLMSYLTGGFAVGNHLIIIKFKDKKIIDFWTKAIHPELNNKIEIQSFLPSLIDYNDQQNIESINNISV